MNEKWKSIVRVSLAVFIWFGITLIYRHWFHAVVQSRTGEWVGWLLRYMLVPYGFALPIAYIRLRKEAPVSIRGGTKCSTMCLLKTAIIQSGLSFLAMFALNYCDCRLGSSTAVLQPCKTDWGSICFFSC